MASILLPLISDPSLRGRPLPHEGPTQRPARQGKEASCQQSVGTEASSLWSCECAIWNQTQQSRSRPQMTTAPAKVLVGTRSVSEPQSPHQATPELWMGSNVDDTYWMFGAPGGSVKCLMLDCGSGHDLRVVRSSPALGSTLGGQPAWDSLSLSLCPFPPLRNK